MILAHENFIKAGADIIITNTYKTNTPYIMEKLNCSKTEAEKLIGDAILQAETARKNQSKDVVIAGGIGPYQGGPTSAYNPSMIRTFIFS